MAAMTIALTEFSDNGNSRTYSLASHTVVKPRMVTQKRKVPTGNQVTVEDTIHVQYATEDASGAVMPQRCSFTVTVARPLGHDAADVTAALADFRDIIASDEFTNTVTTQEYLK